MWKDWRQRIKPPNVAWATAELILTLAVWAAGIRDLVPFAGTPVIFVVATLSLWWRGPGWRGIGLRRPSSYATVLALGTAAGLAAQFFGLALEQLVARFVTGELPDVSSLRQIVGNETQLVVFLVLSWTVAAFGEEMVYRGWLLTRLAECRQFSSTGWLLAALASSALFGAAHIYQGISGVIATGVSGLVFAWLYLRTARNLWASIVAHGVMDTTGMILIYFDAYPGI